MRGVDIVLFFIKYCSTVCTLISIKLTDKILASSYFFLHKKIYIYNCPCLQEKDGKRCYLCKLSKTTIMKLSVVCIDLINEA